MALRIVNALAAALSSAVLWATPATAHDQLISTDPGDGAILATMPKTVHLTFSGPPLAIGTTMFVVDANGRHVGSAHSTIERNVVSLRLPTGAPINAWYQVRWRIVSGDGHLLSGSIDFGVGDPQSAPKPELAGTADATSSPGVAVTGPAGPRSTPQWLVALSGAALAFAIWWISDAFIRKRRSSQTSEVPRNSPSREGVHHE